jgi:hypothetical protein
MNHRILRRSLASVPFVDQGQAILVVIQERRHNENDRARERGENRAKGTRFFFFPCLPLTPYRLVEMKKAKR